VPKELGGRKAQLGETVNDIKNWTIAATTALALDEPQHLDIFRLFNMVRSLDRNQAVIVFEEANRAIEEAEPEPFVDPATEIVDRVFDQFKCFGEELATRLDQIATKLEGWGKKD